MYIPHIPTDHPARKGRGRVLSLVARRRALHLVLGQELHNLHEEIVAAQPVDFLDDVLVQALCERKAGLVSACVMCGTACVRMRHTGHRS